MSNNVANLSDTIVPKSDQLNADQLLAGEMTITVTSVTRGNSAEQPIIIGYQGDNGRPYKPCKSMRKIIIFAWGENGNDWIGRSMTLYNKQDVKWAGVEVGGIRISAMSHIQSDIKISVAATKGKKEAYLIKKLATVAAKQQQQKQQNPAKTLAERIAGIFPAFAALSVTADMIVARLGHGIDTVNEIELDELKLIYSDIKSGVAIDTYFINAESDSVITDSEQDPFA
jgi:hypothetical protein